MLFFINLAKHYLTRYGIWGVALGMMLESLGIPVVSTVLELSSGPLVSTGKASIWTVVFFADAGIVIGSIFSYALGYYGFPMLKKAKKKEIYTKKELEIREKIEKHGPRFIFIAQLIGPFRTWASYPAGALRMDFKKFVFYTALGGFVYSIFMVGVSLSVVTAYKNGVKIVEGLVERYSFLSMVAAFSVTIIITYYFIYLYKSNRQQEGNNT